MKSGRASKDSLQTIEHQRLHGSRFVVTTIVVLSYLMRRALIIATSRKMAADTHPAINGTEKAEEIAT